MNSNKLPKRKISSGKVTGNIKYNTDIETISNPNGIITDTFLYRKSAFQFSDFYNRVIQDQSWVEKPRFLLKAKKGKLYRSDEKGLELAFIDLISYYRDLDDPLRRLYDGYHDSMFVRFSLKIGMFTTINHWNMVHRSWEEGFAKAVDVYYRKIHPTYDATSHIPYTAFFDTHFSNRLYFEILDVEYRNKEELQNCIEFVRIDHIKEKEED